MALVEPSLSRVRLAWNRGPGTVAEKAAAAKTALSAQGFTIAGEYTPYPDATVIVTTNDELRNNAAKSELGGFGAAIRVSVTKAKDFGPLIVAIDSHGRSLYEDVDEKVRANLEGIRKDIGL